MFFTTLSFVIINDIQDTPMASIEVVIKPIKVIQAPLLND